MAKYLVFKNKEHLLSDIVGERQTNIFWYKRATIEIEEHSIELQFV